MLNRMINKLKRYLLNILIWIDIGCNVFLFGGSPYETMSSRAGKQADKNVKWACILCKILSKVLSPDHCNQSNVPDYGDNLDEVH